MTDQTTSDFKAMDIDQLLQIAEATNDSDAQFWLGRQYACEDDIKSAEWYMKAAEQGHAKAQFKLAENYLHGDGVFRDYTTAIRFFRQSADQNFAPAQLNLAYMYENGLGVQKDSAKTLYWLRKAVRQNLPEAQFSLGNCYRASFGVEQDFAKAIKWYRRAALQGCEPALEELSKTAEAARKDSDAELLAKALGIAPKKLAAPDARV